MAIPPTLGSNRQPEFLSRYGVVLAVTPSTDRNLFVRIERTQGTSSGTFSQVYFTRSVGDAVIFKDPLPNDNVSRFYRAQHTADGRSNSGYTSIVSAKPALLEPRAPTYTAPLVRSPVASKDGPTRTMVFSGASFLSRSSTQLWSISSGSPAISPGSTTTNEEYFLTLPLPRNVTITQFSAQLFKVLAVPVSIARLYQDDEGSGTSLIATLTATCHASGGAATVYNSSALSLEVTSTRFFRATLSMRNASTESSYCRFVKVSYTRPNQAETY